VDVVAAIKDARQISAAAEEDFNGRRRSFGLCESCVRIMAAGLKVDDWQGVVAAYKKMAAAKREFDDLMSSSAVVSAQDEANSILETAKRCSQKDVAGFLQRVNRATFGRCVTKTLKIFTDGGRTIFLSREYGFVISYSSRAQEQNSYELASTLSYAFVTQKGPLLSALRSCGKEAFNSRAVKDVDVFLKRVETFAGFVKSLIGANSEERVLVTLPIPKSELSFMQFMHSAYGAPPVLQIDSVRVKIQRGGDAHIEVEGLGPADRGGYAMAMTTPKHRRVPDEFALLQLRQMGVLALLAGKVNEVAKGYQELLVNVKTEFEKELLTEAI